MEKNIKYHGKEYTINYTYKQERRIDGYTTHIVDLLKIDGKHISPCRYEWNDKNNESIIGHIKTVIDNYNKEHMEKFSYQTEFNQWSGDLDNWDE